MKKQKKILLISLLIIDVVLTVSLFVLSIVMLTNMHDPKELEVLRKLEDFKTDDIILYLQVHSTLYLCIGVIPLFLLLAGNIVGLMVYVKKSNEKKKVALNELTAEQKEALRQELLKDLTKDKQE